MTKEEFIINLFDELEIEEEVNVETMFQELDDWDSLAAMVLIGFVSDEFSITLVAKDFEELTTIDSLIEKIGLEKFK